MPDIITDTVIAEVLVNAIAAVGRRIAAEAATVSGHRSKEDLEIARWFDTYRLTSDPPELPTLSQAMSEQLARFLRGNDVQAILHELLADRLTDAPEREIERVGRVFAVSFSRDLPEHQASLGRVLFDYYDGQISELAGRLSGRLEIREPQLLRQIRSEALAVRQIAVLSAIRHDTEILTRRLSGGALQSVALSSDQTESETSASRVVVGDIPLKPPGFQPRADLSTVLDDVSAQESAVYALIGMRGAGKTQLAGAYARARLAERWRLVAWINAGELSGLLAGLTAVAEALGLADHGADKAEDMGQAVRHHLEVEGDRCLVVFDNAADPDVLRLFLPASGMARILITSNRQSMENLGVKISVDAFLPQEALAFLAERTGRGGGEAVRVVASELGYLPLALAQAAAVIVTQHLDFSTYLERLQALRVDEYLSREEGQAYPHGVAEAILLSLDAVRDSAQATMCTAVMEFISVLSVAGLRRTLLYSAGQAGMLTVSTDKTEVSAGLVDSALAQLVERSLLTFSLEGETVIAHRLVMRVVREGLAKTGRLLDLYRAATLVIDRHLQLLDLQDRPAVRDIIEQIAALNYNVANSGYETDDELVKKLLGARLWALKALNILGDSQSQAIMVGEALLIDCELTFGPDHADTLTSRHSLAAAYHRAGRYADALPLLEQTLATLKQVQGPDHTETLIVQAHLARTYEAMGRYAEALTLLEPTLTAHEQGQGPDHHATLAIRNNLAYLYLVTGRYLDAIALYERTLAVRRETLGSEHPDTLATQAELAMAYVIMGRPEGLPMMEQTLAAEERVLGPKHPSTLATRTNLATTYLGMRPGRFVSVYNQAKGRGQIAWAFHAKARAIKAIPLLEQIVADQERTQGFDHPDTLITRGNLANAYGMAGRHTDAIRLFEQIREAEEQERGPDHVDTLATYSNLALAYRKAGRVADAIPLFEQALAAAERVLGPNHTLSFAMRANLAVSYLKAGRWITLWRAHLWHSRPEKPEDHGV